MKNKPVKNAAVDKKIFSETAKKTKTINIKPGNFKGGIRL